MNNSFRKWMLPEGVVEALPLEAEKLNTLKQTALATFARWGYQPLRPPIIEYADTFIGAERSDNLTEQTIQFKDQKSGKQLAFRADITPQIARIDAHYLKTDKVARYAYAGEVVRSYPTGHGSARNPTIIGAELLGSASQQADVEIVSLLVAFLSQLDLPQLTIELGNIDIVIELLTEVGVDESQFSLFFEALAIKDKARLRTLCGRNQVAASYADTLVAMTTIYGDEGVLSEAKTLLAGHAGVMTEVQALCDIAQALKKQHPAVRLHIDLADVHGYGYHNGLIFSAYVNGVWQAIARGGRYDSYGNHFGEEENVRASTGFSCDLHLLSPLLPEPARAGRLIRYRASDFAEADKPALTDYLAGLRAAGDTVIQCFDDASLPNRDCSHQLTPSDNGFAVVEL